MCSFEEKKKVYLKKGSFYGNEVLKSYTLIKFDFKQTDPS